MVVLFVLFYEVCFVQVPWYVFYVCNHFLQLSVAVKAVIYQISVNLLDCKSQQQGEDPFIPVCPCWWCLELFELFHYYLISLFFFHNSSLWKCIRDTDSDSWNALTQMAVDNGVITRSPTFLNGNICCFIITELQINFVLLFRYIQFEIRDKTGFLAAIRYLALSIIFASRWISWFIKNKVERGNRQSNVLIESNSIDLVEFY